MFNFIVPWGLVSMQKHFLCSLFCYIFGIYFLYQQGMKIMKTVNTMSQTISQIINPKFIYKNSRGRVVGSPPTWSYTKPATLKANSIYGKIIGLKGENQ